MNQLYVAKKNNHDFPAMIHDGKRAIAYCLTVADAQAIVDACNAAQQAQAPVVRSGKEQEGKQ